MLSKDQYYYIKEKENKHLKEKKMDSSKPFFKSSRIHWLKNNYDLL